MNKQKKHLAFNTISSFANKIVTVICGFIVPRLILGAFGSDVNGVLHSITQFLGVITLLDMGVGTVVQSSLYKPLVEGDSSRISQIYVSATKFFKRIAGILLIYIVVLVFLFPHIPDIAKKQFDFEYIAVLIIIISVSSFSQYYFGIVNTLLVQADQRGYIQDVLQIITLILNTIACALLIKAGASVQMVRLAASIIFLARPLFLYLYVKKHYQIDRKIGYTEEPIKQKWNGMAQHFASFVLTGTDNIVLTLFSSFSDVSIYSVYSMVVTGVFELLLSLTNGFFPYLGDMWAREEKEKLEAEFAYTEWFMHNPSIFVFRCTGMLIINFVKVYTAGVEDADYIQPLFAIILVVAYAFRTLRIPYNYLILAAGHYKQTQSNYIIAMLLNIILSIAFVFKFGLVGVAVGTFVAMSYQTIWMANYDYKVFLHASINRFIKLLFLDIMITIPGVLLSLLVNIHVSNYLMWIIQAIVIACIWLVLVVSINLFFYKTQCIKLFHFIKRIGHKIRHKSS